jgi:hypothetical protein
MIVGHRSVCEYDSRLRQQVEERPCSATFGDLQRFRFELTPEQRQREEAILVRISAVQKELWKENLPPEAEKTHKAELASVEESLEAFHAGMRQANPRYASIRYPEPISINRIQDELLDEQTVLVEFLLGEKRSLVWVVSKNKLATAVLPPRKEMEEQVAAYRKALTERAQALRLRQSFTDVNRLGEKMYASILKPVEGALTSSRKLIIVPDGALHYLPFETLIPGPRPGASGENHPAYFVEKFATVYAPSASALVTVRAINEQVAAPTKVLLAFGDPIVSLSTEQKTSTGRHADGASGTGHSSHRRIPGARFFAYPASLHARGSARNWQALQGRTTSDLSGASSARRNGQERKAGSIPLYPFREPRFH